MPQPHHVGFTSLVERLAPGGDLEREVATPLHLALAWQVSRSGGRVEGHELPVRMLEAYLAKPWRDNRSDDRGVVSAKLRVLGRLAAKAANPRWSDRIDLHTYTAAIDHDIDHALAKGADPRTLAEQLLDRADAVLESIEDESGSVVRFSHRPFHEGLVTHWLTQMPLDDRVRVLDEHEHDPSWSEVVRRSLLRAGADELDCLLGENGYISRAACAPRPMQRPRPYPLRRGFDVSHPGLRQPWSSHPQRATGSSPSSCASYSRIPVWSGNTSRLEILVVLRRTT